MNRSLTYMNSTMVPAQLKTGWNGGGGYVDKLIMAWYICGIGMIHLGFGLDIV
jgi:hypothetical protein